MKRPCIIEGCAALTTGTRCVVHQRRQQRGYGAAHDRARRTLAAMLPVRCAYCGELVQTTLELAAAHVVDGRPELGWQPSHRACNQGAKTR